MLISTLLTVSCKEDLDEKNVSNEQTEVYISESANSLKELLLNRVKKTSRINAEIALKSIIELFEKSLIDTTSSEEPIDIYVIYGIDFWEENEEYETFQITLAHQVVENEVLYENRISLTYKPDDFEQIREFDQRFRRGLDNLKEFRMVVEDSPGFKKSLLSTPIKIEIIKEEI